AVIRVRSAELCTPAERELVRAAAGVILDAYDPGQLGGTGRSFSWEWVTQARAAGSLADWPPILLAGGLTPENVTRAIQIVRPYGVDVASGVERDDHSRRKDPQKLVQFVRAARTAGQ